MAAFLLLLPRPRPFWRPREIGKNKCPHFAGWPNLPYRYWLAPRFSMARDCDATPADDAYLAQLRAVGLTWPPSSEEALIGEAHLICYDLTWGWQPPVIADDIHDHLNKRA